MITKPPIKNYTILQYRINILMVLVILIVLNIFIENVYFLLTIPPGVGGEEIFMELNTVFHVESRSAINKKFSI